MADAYIRNIETGKIVCTSFPENELDDILTCYRIIWKVGMNIFDAKTGIMEHYLVDQDDFKIIH